MFTNTMICNHQKDFIYTLMNKVFGGAAKYLKTYKPGLQQYFLNWRVELVIFTKISLFWVHFC